MLPGVEFQKLPFALLVILGKSNTHVAISSDSGCFSKRLQMVQD
ncbi:MAG: hypothetical protein FD123_1504 [Bacteroidetes bacterium]|nr:MAG: hypothetical protein FD123_1504 [Bacteroidota bacterium]